MPAKQARGRVSSSANQISPPSALLNEIQDVKVTKDMLDLARHIVNQKAGRFEPDKFKDQYETRSRRSHQPEARRQADHPQGAAARRERGRSDERPAQEHRRHCRRNQGSEEAGEEVEADLAGQKEMLMPIAGKKEAKEPAVKKPAPKRKSA